MIPHDETAERALLLSLLAGAEDNSPVRAAQYERLKPEDFYIVRYGWIYEAMLALAAEDKVIDVPTVSGKLQAMGRLEECGGAAGLTELSLQPGPFPLATASYAKTIRQHAERRRMLVETLSAIADMFWDETLDPVIAHGRAVELMNHTRPHSDNPGFIRGAQSVALHEQMLMDAARNQSWVPVPWSAMAERAPVIEWGDIVVVVGPEGAGKSALLYALAEFGAQACDVPTAYIHTEMRKKQVLDRRLVKHTPAVAYKRLIKPADLTDVEWDTIAETNLEIATWAGKLDIWHAGLIDEDRLLAIMQRMVDDFGTRIFVLDYLNDVVLDEGSRRTNNAALWRDFLARLEKFNNDNGTIIVTAAQLNKDGGAYQIGRALKQKAMLYLRLDPTELKHELTFEYDGVSYQYLPGDFSPVVSCRIEKYRGGGRGAFDLLFVGPRYLWTDVPPGFDDGSDDFGAYGDVYRGGQ
jgi:replicative DNA helicase